MKFTFVLLIVTTTTTIAMELNSDKKIYPRIITDEEIEKHVAAEQNDDTFTNYLIEQINQSVKTVINVPTQTSPKTKSKSKKKKKSKQTKPKQSQPSPIDDVHNTLTAIKNLRKRIQLSIPDIQKKDPLQKLQTIIDYANQFKQILPPEPERNCFVDKLKTFIDDKSTQEHPDIVIARPLLQKLSREKHNFDQTNDDQRDVLISTIQHINDGDFFSLNNITTQEFSPNTQPYFTYEQMQKITNPLFQQYIADITNVCKSKNLHEIATIVTNINDKEVILYIYNPIDQTLSFNTKYLSLIYMLCLNDTLKTLFKNNTVKFSTKMPQLDISDTITISDEQKGFLKLPVIQEYVRNLSHYAIIECDQSKHDNIKTYVEINNKDFIYTYDKKQHTIFFEQANMDDLFEEIAEFWSSNLTPLLETDHTPESPIKP
jgi:hypothetical protein